MKNTSSIYSRACLCLWPQSKFFPFLRSHWCCHLSSQQCSEPRTSLIIIHWSCIFTGDSRKLKEIKHFTLLLTIVKVICGFILVLLKYLRYKYIYMYISIKLLVVEMCRSICHEYNYKQKTLWNITGLYSAHALLKIDGMPL